MSCPKLEELPAPPAGKIGWPWTKDCPRCPESMPDGKPWPKISIITPNYNYGRFLEKTIRSVLLQGYPNLEYIIIDGGSTDNSVEIIKKYEKWLKCWVSEKDEGQTQAINKGFKISSGEIANWLNSDDWLYPGVLSEVAKVWRKENPHLVIGSSVHISESQDNIPEYWCPKPPISLFRLITGGQVEIGLAQPSVFVSLSLIKDIGYLKEDLEIIFDTHLYISAILNLGSELKSVIIPFILSGCLNHPEAKTANPTLLSRVPLEKELIFREIRQKLSWRERLAFIIYLKEIKLEQLIGDILITDKRRFWKLLRISFFDPSAYFSRFFWGALIRSFNCKRQ
jgi:glycosyltransferase involved in cell wall biosynthesis